MAEVTGRPAVSEAGNRYGKLVVLEKASILYGIGARWVCRCDCGNTVVVRGTQLRKGAQVSCGCTPARFIDLSGQRFGKLTVVKRVPSLKRNGTRFLCRCDCGKEVVRLAASLRSGAATSCGCWKSLPVGEGSFRALYRATEHNARYRGVFWGIDIDFFRWITKQPCHYCGDEPYQIYQPGRKMGGYVFNGIDRVDNEIGYTEENCVPCCGVCNYMKSATSVSDFREWITQVYNHWASKSS